MKHYCMSSSELICKKNLFYFTWAYVTKYFINIKLSHKLDFITNGT